MLVEEASELALDGMSDVRVAGSVAHARESPRPLSPKQGSKAPATRMLLGPPTGSRMTSYELEQRQTDDPSLVHVDVTGELDLTNAHEVEERLEAITVANGSRLVLDLNRVVFIDSAALHVLFRTARRLGKDRFSLLVAPTAAVARTLEIVGIADVATVSESTAEPPLA